MLQRSLRKQNLIRNFSQTQKNVVKLCFLSGTQKGADKANELAQKIISENPDV